jgi:hypothetical protein
MLDYMAQHDGKSPVASTDPDTDGIVVGVIFEVGQGEFLGLELISEILGRHFNRHNVTLVVLAQ